MLRVGNLVLGVDDLPRAIEFWTGALDYVVTEGPDPQDGFTVLGPTADQGTHLALLPSRTPIQSQPRVHLDLHADGAIDQAREVERLVGLGASMVEWAYPDDPDFVVLADTEGNRFCVVDSLWVPGN
jgi:catechol 2,3-dioxygenase-like lactoylglutathione lyase family enzyme